MSKHVARLGVGALAVVAFVVYGLTTIGYVAPPRTVTFKKTVLDREFRSEGVAVADVNRDGKPDVLAGKNAFYDMGCPACHTPKFVTRRDAPNKAQAFQLIWPYSDFLLHDMGEGLADGRPEGVADGREWRTPPLWGIGLVETVNGHTRFLHDGRARSIEEAILWHGGEAEGAKERFEDLPAKQRKAILAFLNSL